jgi:hypothetical protein
MIRRKDDITSAFGKLCDRPMETSHGPRATVYVLQFLG